MKTRIGFVTNSSSTSYIIVCDRPLQHNEIKNEQDFLRCVGDTDGSIDDYYDVWLQIKHAIDEGEHAGIIGIESGGEESAEFLAEMLGARLIEIDI